MNFLRSRRLSTSRGRALFVSALIVLVFAISGSDLALASSSAMFEAPFLPFDVGGGLVGLVTGDWNHDGRADVAVGDGAVPGVGVFLGAGDGTFGSRANYPTAPIPYGLAAADVNGDGEEDLVVADLSASWEANPGRINILHGRGDGSFGTVDLVGYGFSYKGVAVADLNGDGHPDIVAGNGTTGMLSVFMGSSAGFGARTDVAAGLSPTSVSLADCDGDGVIDAVVANTDYYNGAITLLHGNHDGTFSLAGTFSVGSFPTSVALADLNEDGHLDVVTANNGIASVSATVLFGDGAGGFGDRADFSMPGEPFMVAAQDVNLDGHRDLLVSCEGGVLSLLLGVGDGSFAPRADYRAGPHATGISVADANNDGAPDIFVAAHAPGSIGVLLGNGDGTFGLGRHLSTSGEGSAVRAADLDEDGHPELLAINQTAPHGAYGSTFTVFHGLGDGSFGPGVEFGAGLGPSDLEVADVNGDGHADVVIASPISTPSVIVRLGDGTGAFGPPSSSAAGPEPFDLAVGDLNGDSHPDIAVTQYWSDSTNVVLLFGVGDGTFVRGVDLVAADPVSHVAIGDATGDGEPDVVVTDPYAGVVSVFPGLGNGTFAEREDYPVGVNSAAYPSDVLIRDLNSDGLQDLAVANSHSDLKTVTVLLNTGIGFAPKTEYNVVGGDALLAQDFNSDGHLDLAAASWYANSVSVLLGAGTGAFGARRDFGVGPSPISLAAGDFDSDGRVDLAVRGGGVWVLRNATPGAPTDVTSDPPSERPKPLPTAAGLERLGANPSGGAAAFRCVLPSAGRVTLKVFDVRGALVATLIDRVVPAGSVDVRWEGTRTDGTRVATGMYFLRMEGAGKTLVRKVALLR